MYILKTEKQLFKKNTETLLKRIVVNSLFHGKNLQDNKTLNPIFSRSESFKIFNLKDC